MIEKIKNMAKEAKENDEITQWMLNLPLAAKKKIYNKFHDRFCVDCHRDLKKGMHHNRCQQCWEKEQISRGNLSAKPFAYKTDKYTSAGWRAKKVK